jgi:hypothetical protein
MRGRALGQHTDIERVAVAADGLAAETIAAQFGDALAAVGLRDEAVERRRKRGELLWAVEPEMARALTQLVLDGIGRHDLDVGVDDLGRVFAGHDAVPRMRLKHQREQLL